MNADLEEGPGRKRAALDRRWWAETTRSGKGIAAEGQLGRWTHVAKLLGQKKVAIVMTDTGTGEFSGGPWTSAVQGAKIINIFLTAKNAEIAEKKRDLLPRKGTKERKKDGGIEKRKRGILTAK
jgi:hypothetical protein